MEFFNDIINWIKSAIQPDRPLKNLYDEIANETRIHFNPSSSATTSASAEAVTAAEESDESSESNKPLVYETDEQANRAFLTAYWIYMTNYYGRPPQFRSDIFCGMFPMDVLNKALDPDFSIRYWWFSVQHPITKILKRNGAELEGTFDSGLYGICCICRDEYIETLVDWIVELSKMDETKALDNEARSAYSRDRDRINPIVMEYEDEDDAAAEDGEQGVFVGSVTMAANGVGSKKDD